MKTRVNINGDSSRTKWQHFFQGRVLQLRQPNVRTTGLLKEVPHSLRAATSRASNGGLMPTWIGKGLLLFFLRSPNSWVVLVLCGAESLWERGFRLHRAQCEFWEALSVLRWCWLGPLTRFSWIRGGFGLSWCWMRPRELPQRWERGEREECEGEGGANDCFSGGEVIFEVGEVWFEEFFRRRRGVGEGGYWSDVSDEGCFVGDWGFDCVYDCGCNWASDWSWDWTYDWGWGWDSLHSFFSSFLEGWVSRLSLLLFKLVEVSSPQAVLLANYVFFSLSFMFDWRWFC